MKLWDRAQILENPCEFLRLGVDPQSDKHDFIAYAAVHALEVFDLA